MWRTNGGLGGIYRSRGGESRWPGWVSGKESVRAAEAVPLFLSRSRRRTDGVEATRVCLGKESRTCGL